MNIVTGASSMERESSVDKFSQDQDLSRTSSLGKFSQDQDLSRTSSLGEFYVVLLWIDYTIYKL
jgi:hypothetical protein